VQGRTRLIAQQEVLKSDGPPSTPAQVASNAAIRPYPGSCEDEGATDASAFFELSAGEDRRNEVPPRAMFRLDAQAASL